MNSSPINRKTSHARGHRSEITYKVWVCDWIRSHTGARGTVHHVFWMVANRKKGRTFRTLPAAEDFHGELKAAAAAGLPFDGKSGLPLSMASHRCGHRRDGRPHHGKAGGGA